MSENILGEACTKLVVVDMSTEKELAVVTNEEIATANPEIVVKLTPKYD